MVGEITKRRIAQMEAKYEIAQMEQELERMTREATYNNVRLIFIVAIVALAAVLGVVVINRKQFKKKASGEISLRNTEIRHQTEAIAQQQEIITEKSAQIAATAQYALRVQEAVVHTTPTFLNIFSDHFLISQAKEVASGDFCWFAHQNDSVLVAVADCTGFGMQGAFNTVVAHNLLTQIASETQYRTPADMLRELDRKLSKLMQSQQSQGYEERMKIAICSININNKRITYAGAAMPLYVVAEGKLKVVQADNICLDGKQHRQADIFTNQMLNLKKGDKVLLLTNGFEGQTGGDEGKALGTSGVHEMLSMHSASSLPQMKEHLGNSFEDWKGLRPQDDDVLAFGLQL
jgi:serine phosphatase RsbU (regulator of sigma subunit)